ncbi:MAG: hypothetical protein LBS37_02685 [Treponema sp.]|jgi:hypothetical protein|nr:hypothetical protein [Treponema sp.]
MKRLVGLFLLVVCFGGSVFAFDIMSYPPPVSEGDILIDAGLGIGIGFPGTLKIPPLFVQAEYALPKVPLSVGGGVTFWQNGYSIGAGSYSVDYTFNYLAILTRANWHWGFDISWLDFYTGLSLGYNAFWMDYKLGSAYGSGYSPVAYNYGGIGYGVQVGAHFYFTKNIGAIVEIGYPVMRVGLAFKL